MNTFNLLSLYYEKLVNNETNQGQYVNKIAVKSHNMDKDKTLKEFYLNYEKLMLELEKEASNTFIDLKNYEKWLDSDGKFEFRS